MRPEKHQVFTDSGRTLRVETERKKGGSESEGARKTEANRERERERYKELDRECVSLWRHRVGPDSVFSNVCPL